MIFGELEIGQVFQFSFDCDSEYTYKKIGDNSVECVSCPKTENCVGQVDSYHNMNSEVDLIDPEKARYQQFVDRGIAEHYEGPYNPWKDNK